MNRLRSFTLHINVVLLSSKGSAKDSARGVFNNNTAELSWVARQRLGDGKISPSEVQQRCDIARD